MGIGPNAASQIHVTGKARRVVNASSTERLEHDTEAPRAGLTVKPLVAKERIKG
ncbi:MAG: hypothetical protein ACJASJ_000090 [Candidatus Azotimanducaceae bacterium]|jgi:hypothetical protein